MTKPGGLYYGAVKSLRLRSVSRDGGVCSLAPARSASWATVAMLTTISVEPRCLACLRNPSQRSTSQWLQVALAHYLQARFCHTGRATGLAAPELTCLATIASTILRNAGALGPQVRHSAAHACFVGAARRDADLSAHRAARHCLGSVAEQAADMVASSMWMWRCPRACFCFGSVVISALPSFGTACFASHANVLPASFSKRLVGHGRLLANASTRHGTCGERIALARTQALQQSTWRMSYNRGAHQHFL